MADPKEIGGHRVLRELGRGGMAQVFLAEDSSGARVVLKRMLPAIAGNPNARDLFRREAKVATLLDHPHIVRVRELIESDGELALVMEYLEGLTLREISHRAWLNGRSLPLEPLVQAMVESALALHHAHHLVVRGRDVTVVHRDVSPDNLVLTTSGVTKLIDFGVAKPDQGADLTVGGQLRGKPSYMSPEQITGGKLDGRSDLWGLGVSFFYLLTGRRPFKRDGAVETMRAIVQEEPPSLKELNPRIPREVAMVIRGILVKDIERRTSTGAEVAAQLSSLLRGIPAGYLPAGRLLATVEDLDEKGNGEHPPVAAIPSVDWDGGARKPDVSYDETRLVDPSAAPTFAGGQTRVPLVGALDLPDEEREDEPDLVAAANDLLTDVAPALPEPGVPDDLAAQATVLMSREEMVDTPRGPGGGVHDLKVSIDDGLNRSATRPMPAPDVRSFSVSAPHPDEAAATRPVAALVGDDDDDDVDDLPRTVVMQAHVERPPLSTATKRKKKKKGSLAAALLVGVASFALTLAVVAGLLFSGVIDLRRLGISLEPLGETQVDPAPNGGTPAP